MISIAIASDHAGFEYKEAIKKFLISRSIVIEDFGTYSLDPVDYPEYIRAAALAVASGKHSRGIILGESGNEAIVANRIRYYCGYLAVSNVFRWSALTKDR